MPYFRRRFRRRGFRGFRRRRSPNYRGYYWNKSETATTGVLTSVITSAQIVNGGSSPTHPEANDVTHGALIDSKIFLNFALQSNGTSATTAHAFAVVFAIYPEWNIAAPTAIDPEDLMGSSTTTDELDLIRSSGSLLYQGQGWIIPPGWNVQGYIRLPRRVRQAIAAGGDIYLNVKGVNDTHHFFANWRYKVFN